VVAVVLLLGVAVLLAAVAAPLVFGTASDFGSESPDADFAFLYEEGTQLDLGIAEDDFGTPVEQGHGLVTIQLERGDTLDPANIEIRGNVSGGHLLNDTASTLFGPGESMRDGDVVRLTVVRGETVEIIWTGDGGEESAIIGSFVVEAPDSLTPPWGSSPGSGGGGSGSGAEFVPEADYGCEYIEDQIPGDVEVIGVIVECDLNKYYPDIDDITIESEDGDFGAIIGEVNGTGDIDVTRGGTFEGNTESGTAGDNGDVDVADESLIYSDIIAAGDGGADVDIVGQSEVDGLVNATGGVDVKGNSSVSEEILSGVDGSGGDVDIAYSRVGDNITTLGDGDIDISNTSTVDGRISATGDISVQEESIIAGEIISGTTPDNGDVQVSGSDIDGGITAQGNGSVDISNISTVDGDIDASGQVDVQENSVVDGGILSGVGGDDGDVQISNSDINGDIVSNNQGKVDADGNSDIAGGIDAEGQVDASEGTSIGDNVTATGDITLDNATVDGGLTTTNGANIDISNAEINGHIDPAGTFSCSNSLILGQTCSEYKTARLDVNITGTNSPVSKGDDDLNIDLTITNNGFADETDIFLLIDGTQEKSKEVDLEADAQDTYQFEWDTSTASIGEHNATVTSDVDTESTTVYVAPPAGPAFAVESINASQEVFAYGTLSVSATIRNSGEDPGTREVRLQDFDGQTVDSASVYIEDGETKQVTLEWATSTEDIGTGQVTVDTDADSKAASTEVLANYYEIEDIVLYRSGQDMEVELFLNTSNNGTAEIEVRNNGGNTVDSMTVEAESDVYTMLEDKKAKKFKGEVVVTLYDNEGNERDSASEPWNGGGKGGGGGPPGGGPPGQTADSVETVDGTTPSGESGFLEFDVQVDRGASATITGFEVTTPGNQNSGVNGAFNIIEGANPEAYFNPSVKSGANQAGQDSGAYTVGTIQPLDTNGVFTDGSVLDVRLGKLESGNVQLTYYQVDKKTDSDVTVTVHFDDGSSYETYLRVTNVNS
jgi:hypothetical protein